MTSVNESWYAMSDGFQVYVRTWESTTPTPPRAHLILLHGFSDHSGLYDTFSSLLIAAYPIKITSFDRRGWGRSVRSPSDRGMTGPNTQVLSDLNEFLTHQQHTHTELPQFVMAHSMGGQELLFYLLSTSPYFESSPRPMISGIILDAPYIRLVHQPSSIQVALAKIALYVWPSMQIKNAPNTIGLCRDPKVVKEWLEDPLCHDTGTLEGLAGTLEREKELTQLSCSEKGKTTEGTLQCRLPCPVLWCHGTEDGAVRFDTSHALFERLEGCDELEESRVFRRYTGWFHQLHAEPGDDKKSYALDVGDWIMGMIERTQT